MFIKSLLTSLEFRKKHPNNLKRDSQSLCKKNYKKVGILKSNKKFTKEKKIKRNLSYNVKESKYNLKGLFSLKSKEKLIDNNSQIDTENILLKSFSNKNLLSTNNFNTIEKNKLNIFYRRKINNKEKYLDNKIKKFHFKKYLQRNNKFNDENKDNKFPKIKESLFKKEIIRKEYLKFLEKKSLSLRANYIMNNIQDCRGRKQELRSLYNPLNV